MYWKLTLFHINCNSVSISANIIYRRFLLPASFRKLHIVLEPKIGVLGLVLVLVTTVKHAGL